MNASPSRTRPLLLVASLLALLLPAAWFLLRRHRQRAAQSIPVRLVLALDPGAWDGIPPRQQRGIRALLKDHLDLECGFPILLGEDLLMPPSAESTVLHLGGRRTGSRLSLIARVEGPSGAFSFATPSSLPGEAFLHFRSRFASPDRKHDCLTPSAPDPFWELVDLLGWTGDQDVPTLSGRARQLAQKVPDCPAVWLILAELDVRTLILSGESDPEVQERCRACFQKAQELLPNYPRATYDASLLDTDTGNQREAMDHLLRTIRTHPQIPYLRHGLAYAARTVGLLEGSRRALQARDRLQGPSRAGRLVAENTYLYSGDWRKFAESLGEGPDPYEDEVVNFYRGYLRLIQRDPTGAQPWFARAVARPGTKVEFEALSRAFLLALQDRTPEARQILDALQTQRTRLRVPDGEFTFKLAEGYALIGAQDDAMHLAERAFAQGFSCRPWFEASPLLAPLRAQPRWQALRQHLQEREQLLEERFPPEAFGS